jgi:NADPH:quinone reductase-like Zn-dependent oxidoreductase
LKAIRIHQFGPTEDALQYEDIPVPQPGTQQILIKVEAASLNRADLGLRRGSYRVAPEDLPIIPGRELAGTVAQLGADVRDFEIGQRVLAYPGKGGYAEYAVSNASLVRPIPAGVDSATAAAVPTVFLTAWFALLEDARLSSGDCVLIQAGSSGVGNAAIQIAKHRGARVVATAGTDDKCRRVRELGAELVINYAAKDFAPEVLRFTGSRGADIVLEMIGGDVYEKSLQVLAPGGRLVSIGGAFGAIPETPPALTDGRKATRFSITNYLATHPEGLKQLDQVLNLIRDGTFKVIIDRRFPLAEARAAQRYLESRDHFGKVVLVV